MKMSFLQPWIAPLILAGLGILAGYLFDRVVLGRLGRLFQTTKSVIDDVLLETFGGHIGLWLVLAGLAAAAQTAPIAGAHRALAAKILVSAFFFSVTWASARLAGDLMRRFSAQRAISQAMAGLMNNLVKIAVIALGVLLILSNLGISITPLLTALGVGSLAVALALQDTLTNLFSGIHIVASNLVEVGDYVKLDSGQEGVVMDINWRTTRIKELPNNVILVPNAKLAQAIIINYARPEPETAVLVQMGVSYDADLQKVERVTIEAAKDVQQTVDGAVKNFDPFIRYHTFGDSSINFTVILRARQFTDRFLITHEFIKRIHERYRKEGIEIPFPQRVVHLYDAHAV
ncbi:MAG: mechanosensitive ion channel family protein [Elusimicrobia bacterium]|nr:mechanosensitive ion channel family protein [Elusimicrobiota bacterium]